MVHVKNNKSTGKNYVIGEVRFLITADLPDDDDRKIISDAEAKSILNNQIKQLGIMPPGQTQSTLGSLALKAGVLLFED